MCDRISFKSVDEGEFVFIMEFNKGLKEELQKEGSNLHVNKKILDISSTDIVQLNQRINQMIDDDRIMLESSPSKAARFACSK